MKSMSQKSSAREGRGAGNGYNDNWRNSPLWDNVAKAKTDDVVDEDVPKKSLDELSDKERIKRLQAMAY